MFNDRLGTQLEVGDKINHPLHKKGILISIFGEWGYGDFDKIGIRSVRLTQLDKAEGDTTEGG